jgi:hypothetical protein
MFGINKNEIINITIANRTVIKNRHVPGLTFYAYGQASKNYKLIIQFIDPLLSKILCNRDSKNWQCKNLKCHTITMIVTVEILNNNFTVTSTLTYPLLP